MLIKPFERDNPQYMEELADLLRECFPQSYGDCAHIEAAEITEIERAALMAVSGGHLIGFAGGVAQYGNTGWELHPLAVKKSYQRQGIGTNLVKELERECAQRGAVTLYLGTDDEYGQTTLSNTDLYNETYKKIDGIKNLNNHPYEFYQKLGYKIVGVLPDANGLGKPDIFMAKKISNADINIISE